MKSEREKLREMPVAAKLSYVRRAWEREKEMRLRYLHGKNKNVKVEEANIVMECLDAIEAHLRGHP
jgi:hypothetical protein